MKTKLNLEIEIEIVEALESPTAIARIYYPDEGNSIKIVKGLNAVEFSHAIHHEIGHLFDWYLNGDKPLGKRSIREKNANIIGDSLRYKEPYP